MSRRPTLGIDVGGSKTALLLVAWPEGRVLARESLPTPAGEASAAPFLAEVAAAARRLAAGDVAAVGLSLCELVDPAGTIRSAHRLRWQGLAVAEAFAALGPLAIDADVRAAALAEQRLGAGRALPNFLYVNIGTGISSAWVTEQGPWAGQRGNALLLASSPVAVPLPGGGEFSHVPEDLAGGAGLLGRYNAAATRPLESTPAVLAAAEAGDALARRLVEEAALALGVNLGLAINLLDPAAVVVGGGLGLAGGLYWERLVARTRAQVWAEATRALPILRGALGGEAAALGAALRAGDLAG